MNGARHLNFQTESINTPIHFSVVHPIVLNFNNRNQLELPSTQVYLGRNNYVKGKGKVIPLQAWYGPEGG